MNKILKIPFYKNHGWQCGPRCAAMVLKYYYPELKVDWKKFNRIMHHHRPRTYTYTQQLGLLLDHFGLRVKVFSSEELKTTKEDPKQFQRAFGCDYHKLIKRFDIHEYDWSITEARRHRILKTQRTKFSRVVELFKQGNLVIFPVDWNTLNRKGGTYEGHFVVLTGIKSGGQAVISDPDTRPNRFYPIKRLERAYSHPVITDDVVVVYGRKRLK